MFLPELEEGEMGRGCCFPDVEDRELTTPGGGCLRFGPGELGGGGIRWEKLTVNLRHANMLSPKVGPLWGWKSRPTCPHGGWKLFLSAGDLPDPEGPSPETQGHLPLPLAPGQNQVSDPLTQHRAEPG